MKTHFYKILFLLLFSFTVRAEKHEPFKVAILVFDEVQIIDFAAPYEVFGHAGFEVFTVSETGDPVTTVMGLNIDPVYSFADMPDVDAVVVPGGNVGNVRRNSKVQRWLNQQQGQVEHIMSVCTGSHILAESGLLNGLAATTFHRAINGFARDYPKVTVKPEQRFVDNGQIITSAGLSSGMDAALHLVSKELGMDRAKTIAMHIEYDWKTDGGFVRAMMADRMMPDNHYNWPKDANFKRLRSYGTEDEWEIRWRVTSAADLEIFLSIYSEAMLNNKNWTSVKTGQTQKLQWLGQNKALNWQHTLTVEQSENGMHQFTVAVQHLKS